MQKQYIKPQNIARKGDTKSWPLNLIKLSLLALIIWIIYPIINQLKSIKSTKPNIERLKYDFYQKLPAENISKILVEPKLVIQIATFKNLTHANKLITKLATKKFAAKVVNNRQSYQVFIGPFSNYKNANQNLKQLMQHDFNQAVIRKISP